MEIFLWPEPHDDHCWLTVNGSAWTIHSVHPSVMVLWRGRAPQLEWAAIDMTGLDWGAYCEVASRQLEHGREPGST